MALSRSVLSSCKTGYQYPALISFWASITTEAIAIMVDQTRSARREAQRQNQEDVLMFILPILNDGLSIKNALDLRVGCYMILTVLASKANLEENVLTAIMEAIVSEWEGTSHAGLICLAVLAQQRRQRELSGNVLKAVLSIPSLDNELIVLHKQYQVDRLVLGIVTGMLNCAAKSGDVQVLPQIGNLLEIGLMHERSLHTAVNTILSIIDKPSTTGHVDSDLQESLTDLILRLADSQQICIDIQNAIRDSKLHLSHFRPRLQGITERLELKISMLEDTQMKDADEPDTAKNFDVIASRIPTKTTSEISLLSHSRSYIYDILVQVFCSIHTSNANLERFSDLPVLRKALAMTEPLFLSFYIRLWCGNSPATARAAGLQTVVSFLRDSTPSNDLQILLPYVIYALSDSSLLLRRAAADLVLALSLGYFKAIETEGKPTGRTVLGHEQIYGQNKQSTGAYWLSVKEATRLVADILIPNLEECVLDDQAVSHILFVAITGSKASRDSQIRAHPELKTSLRFSIFSFLCSHMVNSPLYTFKLRMLRILNKVENVGSTSRTKLLLPLLSDAANLGQEKLLKDCQAEQVDLFDFLREVTGTVTAIDREGLQKLRHIAEMAGFEPLQAAAFQRISSIWPQIRIDIQLSLTVALLDLAVRRASGNGGKAQQIGAMETLQSVRLSAATLQHLLNSLPTLSTHLEDEPTAKKRRRTNHDQLNTNLNIGQQRNDQEIRRVSLVLELVESSKVEQHPSLLKGLFQVVTDLKNAQSQSGNATGYLQILAMDIMLAIVKKAKIASDLPIDASTVRIDVLIDYIRTATNPQLRNTALLLVAGLADIAPELVLHSVMPIFTYMGANLLRQEDDFSPYVVRQTMESVIPRLVQSLHRDSKHAFAGVSELLLNFAAAFEHIPQQRRFDIFASLVIKVGATEYLFALFAVLSDKYLRNKGALQLCVQLADHQHWLTQLQTIEKYLQVILEVWEPTSTNSTNLLLLDQGHSAEAITINLLPLAIEIFQSKPLTLKITRILSEKTANAAAARASIAKIFQQIFLLSQICQDNSKLDSLCKKLLDSSLDSIPTQELIHTLESLMGRAGSNLLQKVLQSFEHRLNVHKFDQHAARESCLAFVPRLVSTILESTDSILKQAAVSAIERIVEIFGRTDLPRVVEAGQSISADVCLRAEEADLRVASLLCLTTMIEVSGETIVPIIPLALPKVGNNLELSIGEDTEDLSLHNACYSVFLALLLYVPWMITGPDLDRILSLSYESANADMGTHCNHAREEALQSIARQIDVKELFAALDRTWASAVIEGPKALNDYFEVLRLAIDRQPKSVVIRQTEALGDIFIKAFSLRQAQLHPRTDDSYDNDEIEEAEIAVNETAIAMIYKLNEASFRPMFQRIMEWAISTRRGSQVKVFRQISWYTFLHHFFDTLKSIVTSYAGFIIVDAVEVLQNVRLEDRDFMQLWRRVLQTLQKTFKHDQNGEQSSLFNIFIQ